MPWTLQLSDPSRRAPVAPVTCRTYADLLLHLRVGFHASPDAVVEVGIPASADPDDVRALRRRGCVLHYARGRVDRSDAARRVAAL